MGCPAVERADDLLIVMTRNGDKAEVADIAGKLAKMWGFQKQRHLTMDGAGGGSEPDFTTITNIAQTPTIHALVSANRNGDAEPLTLDQQLFQLNLIAAAGDMVADLQHVIEQLVANTQDYTPEQLGQFVALIENHHKLTMVNEGRLALTSEQIKILGDDTMDLLEDLAKAEILPDSLKEIVIPVLSKTAAIFNIPDLSARIEKFEKDNSPQTKLDKEIIALKDAMTALLAQDDLPEKMREQIEEMLEKLETHTEGEPLDRETMKALKEIQAAIQGMDQNGITLSSETLKALEAIDTQIEKVAELNISARAQKFNITVAQVKSIDAYMDQLETLSTTLPAEEIGLKTMIAETIMALDENPVSLKALTQTEKLSAAIATPATMGIEKMSQPKAVIAAIAAVVAPLQSQTRFVEKIQVDTIAKRDNVPTAHVRETSALYSSLQGLKAAVVATVIPTPPAPTTGRNDDLVQHEKPHKSSDQPLATAGNSNPTEDTPPTPAKGSDVPKNTILRTPANDAGGDVPTSPQTREADDAVTVPQTPEELKTHIETLMNRLEQSTASPAEVARDAAIIMDSETMQQLAEKDPEAVKDLQRKIDAFIKPETSPFSPPPHQHILADTTLHDSLDKSFGLDPSNKPETPTNPVCPGGGGKSCGPCKACDAFDDVANPENHGTDPSVDIESENATVKAEVETRQQRYRSDAIANGPSIF